jgi:hypothetical protein
VLAHPNAQDGLGVLIEPLRPDRPKPQRLGQDPRERKPERRSGDAAVEVVATDATALGCLGPLSGWPEGRACLARVDEAGSNLRTKAAGEVARAT